MLLFPFILVYSILCCSIQFYSIPSGLLLDTIGAGVKAMNYKRCGTLPCSDEYEPVCGAKLMGNGFKTFSNPCEMEYYNCLRGPGKLRNFKGPQICIEYHHNNRH